MSDVYLINQNTFLDFEDLSINIDPKRLLVFVKKMQFLDLRVFMGAAFYTDFIQYFSNDPTTGDLIVSPGIPATYNQLWQGLTYVDKAGHNVGYVGMIPTLVYWTFARFIEADSVRYTATGPVIKRHDEADGLKPNDLIKVVQQQRSVANAYCNDIELFLYNFWNDFTLWHWDQRRKSQRQSGPRITAIDKTIFNAPGVAGSNNNYPGYGNGFDWFN
ncbi:MAG: hypothetical protein P4L31_07485 [Candidatus Babeliales bacterium]|nr:hypothetical protein [Candidatus Babeliales bacterium]